MLAIIYFINDKLPMIILIVNLMHFYYYIILYIVYIWFLISCLIILLVNYDTNLDLGWPWLIQYTSYYYKSANICITILYIYKINTIIKL